MKTENNKTTGNHNKKKKKRRNKQLKFILLTLIMLICLLLAEIGILTLGKKKNDSKDAESEKIASEESVVTAQPSSDQSSDPAETGTTTESVNVAEVETETESETETETEATTEMVPTDEERVEAFIKKMTLEEKVAQLFFVTPDSFMEMYGFNVAGPMTEETFGTYPIAGLIMMGHNLQNVPQIENMLANLQKFSMDRLGLPIFLSTDEEGGTVARVAGNYDLHVDDVGDMWDIGATGDPNKAYEAGLYVGGYLSDLGFNMDFAPVADVLTNPDNQVIGVRSFGSDPTLVSRMSLSFAKGLEEKGIISCYKHFPGHGATAGDTHQGYAYTDKSLEELEQSELIPFVDAVNDGAEMIMIGHISLPYVTEDTMPASLSYEIITGLLRKKLGFDGVVITDALNMGAITAEYSSAEACIMTIQAGADLLLEPYNFRDGYNGVLEAVKNGTISEERIDESLRRIIKLKLKILDQMEEK